MNKDKQQPVLFFNLNQIITYKYTQSYEIQRKSIG